MCLHPISKRVNRQSGVSLFSLPERPSFHKSPCVPGGVAGSLLSVRGYDSDAQCISTPKQTMAPSDRPQTAAKNIDRNLSPLRNIQLATDGFNDEEIGNLPDKQQSGNDQASASPQPTAHGEWNPQSLRGVPAPNCATSRVVSPISNTSSRSINDRNAGSSGPASVSEILGDSTKSRPGMNEVRPRFYATVAQRGFHGVDPASTTCTPYVGSSESLAKNGMDLTIAKKRRTTSRETSSEAGSLHLGNMNISKALASPSMSPRILSQLSSTDGNIRSLSDQYQECVGRERVITPPWCKNEFNFDLSGRRDGSSFYSPKSSISIAGISTDLRIGRAVSSPVGSGKLLSSAEDVPASPSSEGSRQQQYPGLQPDTVRSKFVEEFEINRSISSGSIEAAPRKVSIGWMSGGRRLGYGYALVSDDEGQEENQEETMDSDPKPGIEASNEADNEPTVETTATCPNRQLVEEPSDPNNQRVSSNSDRSATISRLSQRWSGSSTFAKATKLSNSTDRSSSSSSFWDRFTRRNDLEEASRLGTKLLRHGHFPSDLNQPEDRWRHSTWYENGRKNFLDKWTGMRFPLDSGLDQHNAADEHDMEVQAGPDVTPCSSLRQPRRKFRVLNRRRRCNNHSSPDRHSIFSGQQSIWAADAGPISRANVNHVARPGFQDIFAVFGPSRYTPKHPIRVGTDTTDEHSLEMYSEPE